MYLNLAYVVSALVFMVWLSMIVRKTKWCKAITVFMIIIYICSLLYFTMFHGARGNGTGFSFRFPLPFYRAIKMKHYGLATNRSVLNCLLFVPFGFLFSQVVSMYQEKDYRIPYYIIILCGFLTSLAIEISQVVLKRGVFEIDDLVKNTMGASIGYFIWFVIEKLTSERRG